MCDCITFRTNVYVWLVDFFGDFLVMGDEEMHQILKEVQDA